MLYSEEVSYNGGYMYDIIIIGSGPAGLSAAVYASRAQLSFIIVEKEYAGTGQIALSEQVDNYPGMPGINGYDLGESFRSHAEKFGARFYEGEADKILHSGDSYEVRLKDGNSLSGKTIIYAAGTSYRKLDIKGTNLPGVSYCAICDGMFYRNKTVAVVGGGDTALGDALYLSKIAEKVYLIHRRTEFRANKALQERVKAASNIELVLDSQVTEILGESHVEAINLLHSGEKETLEVSGIFVAVGSLPNTAILNGICALDRNGYIVANEDGTTSEKGIFAAGDVRTKKLRQVVTAVADGASCVMSAEEYLR